MRIRAARAVVASSFAIVLGGPPALAGVVTTSCTYDDVSTAAITVSGAATVTVSRNVDAIQVDGVACETATVTNTDTITLDAPTGSILVVNLSGGGLAPGLTDEGDGSSEIELSEVGAGHLDTVAVTGAAGADHLVAGETGGLAAINLNTEESTDDFDVTLSLGPDTDVQLIGNNGADTLAAGTTSSPPIPYPVTLDGGEDGDTLRFFADGGSIDGGGGSDRLDESAATDAVWVVTSLSSLHIENGTDDATVANVEDVAGGDADDTLEGSAGPNHLEGGVGSDVLIGRAGGDTLDGGTSLHVDQMFPGAGQDEVIGETGGLDALSYDDAAGGVDVNLLTGTASGDGDDVLTGDFAAVRGSPFDDILTGNLTANLLEGGGGDDNLRGDAGADTVDGGTGRDVVGGGFGNDHLAGGRGNDVLVGKQGDDEYLGGAGIDEAEFLTATHRMTVDLRDGTASGQGHDQLSGIERVDGGPKADRIRGNGANNDLDGFGGADRLVGRAGNDRLNGGGASDHCSGGSGSSDQAQQCEVVTGVP